MFRMQVQPSDARMVPRSFFEASMLLDRATRDPNFNAFGQTTGDGAGTIPPPVKCAIRNRYHDKCAFCGTEEISTAEAKLGVQKKLSCAHLATRSGYFQNGYTSRFQVQSLRNYILLCGSSGDKGTCHDGFDSHKLALIPDAGLGQGWKVLSNYCHWKANAISSARVRSPAFGSFDGSMVYKRTLATRLHRFFVGNRDACDGIPHFAETVGAVRDLSMSESCRGHREAAVMPTSTNDDSLALLASRPSDHHLEVPGPKVVPPRAGRPAAGQVVPSRQDVR